MLHTFSLCFQVVLPKLLIWYKLDFAGDSLDHHGANYEGLLKFVVSHVTDDLESSIKTMMDWDAVHEFGESIGKKIKGDELSSKVFHIVLRPIFFEKMCS